MFGWFRPRLPVDLREKVWTEYWFRWLIEQFGLERLRSVRVVLPTRDFFPDNYEPTAEHAHDRFRRVCQFMAVSPDRIDLTFFSERDAPHAAGLYYSGSHPMIAVRDTQLADEESLIATLAHEVAHDVLLGGGLLSDTHPEHEPITDLTTVFLGLGVFPANTAVKQEAGHFQNWEYYSVRRSGYLTARVYGYAFALMAWVRGDESPEWAAFLGADAAHAFRAGLKYLRKTGDCLFDPAAPARPDPDADVTQLAADLASRSDTKALSALWTLKDRADLIPTHIDQAAALLARLDPHLRAAVIDVLAKTPSPDESALRHVVDALHDRSREVRRSAAAAVSCLRPPAEFENERGTTVIDSLALLAHEDDVRTAGAAAEALGAYGPQAVRAAPQLLKQLVRALVRVDGTRTLFQSSLGIMGSPSILHSPVSDSSETYFRALERIVPDVEALSREHFDEDSGQHELLVEFLARSRAAGPE